MTTDSDLEGGAASSRDGACRSGWVMVTSVMVTSVMVTRVQ